MTKNEISQRLIEICNVAVYGDDERATNLEKKLRSDFIKHVAEISKPYLSELAKMVLSSSDINFRHGW